MEPVPVGEPGPGQAVVALRRAVINPSDMGMIGGSYGRLRPLPAIAGREGVGEVVAVGPGVNQVSVGQRVRFPEEPGVWREAGIFEAADLFPVPDDVPLDQAAQAFVNALTAYELLETFGGEVSDGDWVIQNAASSALGFGLTQLCRARGLRMLCVVRDERWREPLMAAGAAQVVTEESDYFKRIGEITGGASVKLGINTVGGQSVNRMIKAMGPSGTIVTLGGASSELIRFPTRFLIFNDLRLRGFWMDKWTRTHTAGQYREAMGGVFQLMAAGVLNLPVERVYPLAQAKEAVARNLEKGRMGKVLLSGDWKI